MKRLLALTAMLLIPVLAFGQAQTTGRITGTIVDADGAPVANAKVTIISPAMQGDRSMKSGPDGKFLAGLLPVGPYAVEVAAPGMNTYQVSFRIGVGQLIPLEITLEAGSQIEESITVYGTATPLATTAVGQNLSSQMVEELPINTRTINNIATFAPNVSFGPTGPGGGESTSLAISGAPSYDTVMLLDGAEISDPYFGGGTVVYLEDAIEEVQVLTAGVSARYGRFQGGVVNAVTKSGGNEIDGSARHTWWKESWDSKTPFGENQSDDTSKVDQATLGGFVLRDHLWFFGGYREIPETSTTSTTVQTGDSYTTAANEDRWSLKLRGAPNPNHVIEASKLEFDSAQTNRAGLPAGDLRAATGTRADPREATNLTYQAVLSPSLFLDVQGTEKEAAIISGASDIGLGSPIMDWTSSGFRVYGNHWWGGTADPDSRNNESYGANLNWVKSTGKVSHSFEFGVQGVNSTTGGKNSQSATGFNFVANAPGPGGLAFVTSCGVDGAGDPLGIPCTFNVDTAFDIERWNAPAVGVPAGGFEADVENLAIYAQDTLSYGKWRFDMGLRWETYDGKGPFISETVNFDEIAPRLGVTYNIDDNWQVQGTWAQYTSRINDNVSNSVTFVGENPSQTEGYTGPTLVDQTYDQINALLADDPAVCGGEPNGSCWNIIKDVTDPNLPTTFLTGNLEAPHANDLNFSLKRRLPRNSGYVTFTYTDREFNNLLDDFRGGFGTVDIPDPGGGAPTTIDATLWGNAPQARRDYESLTMTVDYRPAARWNIGGNWTLSETTGNYEGEGQNTPGSGSEIGDFVLSRPDQAAVPVGLMDEHIRHRARLWGNYRFDFGRSGNLSLGSVATFQSGRVWSRIGNASLVDEATYFSDVPNTYEHFFDGRGANEFSSWWALDMSVNYQVKLWRQLETFVRLNVRNVLDNDTLVAFDTRGNAERINQTAVPPGSPGDADSDGFLDDTGILAFAPRSTFGDARNEDDYQLPRTIRVSMGFRW